MNKVKITTDKIYNKNANKEIIITHISDIHFNTNTKYKNLQKVSEALKKIKPNYLMITGDTIDENKIINNKQKIRELTNFFKNISSFTKVLISLGNHDILKDSDVEFFNKLGKINNIYLLNNTSYMDDYIYVAGLTLPTSYYYNVTGEESIEILLENINKNLKITSNLSNNRFKVLLIHSPIKVVSDIVLTELVEFDLILSGHTHNGMIPDFLNKLFKKNMGIIAPNNDLFPKVARGKIEKVISNNKITIIINGGITKLSKLSGKGLSKLNFLYNMSINKIIITNRK